MNNELAEVEKRIDHLEDELHKGATTEFCGIAFISFNTETEKNKVLAQHKVSDFERMT